MFRGPKYGWRYVKSSGRGFFVGERDREPRGRVHPGKVQTTESRGGIFFIPDEGSVEPLFMIYHDPGSTLIDIDAAGEDYELWRIKAYNWSYGPRGGYDPDWYTERGQYPNEAVARRIIYLHKLPNPEYEDFALANLEIDPSFEPHEASIPPDMPVGALAQLFERTGHKAASNRLRRFYKEEMLPYVVEATTYRDPDESEIEQDQHIVCLLYTSPSPRDRTRSRMPSSA